MSERVKKYKVLGMSCVACSSRVEKAAFEVEGVKSATVNLLMEVLEVSGDFEEQELYVAIRRAGYELVLDVKREQSNGSFEDSYIKETLERLAASLLFVLFIVLNTRILNGMDLFLRTVGVGFACLLILILNRKFFVNGVKGIINKAPNMDTLVCFGSGISFAYGLFLVVQSFLNTFTDESFMYFETSGMIVTFVSIGKYLEERAKGQTKNAVEGLRKLIPDMANVVEDTVRRIPVAEVKVNDVFVVKSGEYFPLDGVVIEGNAFVNESALTGESMWVHKAVNDKVFAGTVNENGCVYVRTTQQLENTSLSRIIDMCEETASTKAPIAGIADKVAAVFVPCVIAIAVITFALWIGLGHVDCSKALFYAVSVLVVSCPCAMGLATPVAIMVAIGVGAKDGLLFKDAAVLENLSKIKSIVFDKTGTLTEGKPQITEIYIRNEAGLFEKISLQDCITKYPYFISYIYSIEKVSEHPLGMGICDSIDAVTTIGTLKLYDVNVVRGRGVIAKYDEKILVCGSVAFLEENSLIDAEILNIWSEITAFGKTPTILALDGKVLGVVALLDVPRRKVPDLIVGLRKRDINVIMLTGDNERTAGFVAEEIGINEVKAGVLPEDKAYYVKELKKNGLLAMVGDGINDSIALAEADVGIVMSDGSEIAIDSADLILTGNDLGKIEWAIELSKKTVLVIKQNLAWAFVYNLVGIPLAAGAFGYRLPPYFASLTMGLSSFCVVCNALRLNRFNIRGNVKMINKKMIVEGMMCEHCEARVKSALEKISGVESALPDHNNNIVSVVADETVTNDTLKEAVENQGYKVISVE